jgi:hypothetical protein
MIKMNGNGDGLHFKHEVAGTPVMTYAHGVGATTTLIDENGAWAGATNSVLKSGDTMSGALNMGGNNISNAGTVAATAFSGDGSALTNISAGTHNHDAAYVNVGGDTMSGQLTSTVADGTAPFVVASTTKVTNLNADALDGLDSTAFMAATADNWVDAGGDAMTGALNMGGNNITNAGTVTATAFDGDGSALTNISAGTHNHDASYVNVGGDTMSGQLTSTVADGTAPFVVASTTKVTNLNADALDGLDSTAFMAATADNWVDAGGDAMTGALTMNNVGLNMNGADGDIAFNNAGGNITLAGGAISDSAGDVNINDGLDVNGTIQSSLGSNSVVFQHDAPGRMALRMTDSTESVISWSPTGFNLAWNVWEDGANWQNGNGASPSANLRVSKGTLGTDRALEFMSALSGTPELNSRLAITYAGNVGIGISTPTNKLHVDNAAASGNGAYFNISNAANNTGQTIYAVNSGGGSSRAGRFENTNAANTACSLWSNNTGGGEALCGDITNTDNSSDALKITTDGDGRAASFAVTKAANTTDAVKVSHDGAGSGTTAAIKVTTTNTAHGIDSRTTGTAGRAGKFMIENVANNNDVLYISTAYTGGGSTMGRLIDTNKGAYLTNEGAWVAAGGFLPNYTSADTAITVNQTRTFNHGLGRLPILIQAWVRCTSGEGGGVYGDSSAWKPIASTFEDTNVYYGSVVEAITITQIIVRAGGGAIWHGHKVSNYCTIGEIRVMAW